MSVAHCCTTTRFVIPTDDRILCLVLHILIWTLLALSWPFQVSSSEISHQTSIEAFSLISISEHSVKHSLPKQAQVFWLCVIMHEENILTCFNMVSFMTYFTDKTDKQTVITCMVLTVWQFDSMHYQTCKTICSSLFSWCRHLKLLTLLPIVMIGWNTLHSQMIICHYVHEFHARTVPKAQIWTCITLCS